MTLPAFVATLVPTFYGGALGIGEFTWQHGLSNWLVMGLPYYVFAAVYALFLAGRVRLEPGLTIPDHLENAYGRDAAVFAAFLVFVLACPADDLLMVGILLSHLAGLGLAAAMLIAAIVVWAVLLRGGLRSDVWANRLQFALVFGGFSLLLAFAWTRLGSLASLAARLPAGHMTWTGSLPPLKIAGWWLIAVWTLVDPSFHQRCAAASTPAVARKGIFVSIGFWALLDLLTTSAGLYARATAPELASPLLAFPILADRLLPPLARGLFYAGLCSSILAALQGKTLQASVSLGKDCLGRWFDADAGTLDRWSKTALIPTGLFAFALAWLLPSVVGLWYAVGSAVIPGLLLPLLGVYFPRLRVSSRWALAVSLAGELKTYLDILASLGRHRGTDSAGASEPMFPGLAASERRSGPPAAPSLKRWSRTSIRIGPKGQQRQEDGPGEGQADPKAETFPEAFPQLRQHP